MATIFDMIRKIDPIDIQQEAIDAFNKNAAYAEELNRVQLKHGVRGDGFSLPPYSYSSVHHYGKPAGPIRLYETGAFYQGIRYKAEGTVVKSYSTDEKNDMLTARYGDEITTLLRESKIKLWISKIRPDLVLSVGSKTGMRYVR